LAPWIVRTEMERTPPSRHLLMHLDIVTLTIAAGFVAMMAGLLLAGAWTQIPRAPELAWWAAASFTTALAVICITIGAAGQLHSFTVVGTLLNIESPALLWAGMRIFHSRPLPVLGVVAGTAAWMIVDVTTGSNSTLANAFGFIPAIAYIAASAWELWRGRSERLRGRYGLIGILALHAFVLTGGAFDMASGSMTVGELPVLGSWFGIISFEGLLHSMASAVFMILLTKERSERRYIVAARQDSLTGIANRGALLEGGERLLRRCKIEGRSLSVIMFDLDRFKWINDTFGHPTGDAVLRAFASAAEAAIRPGDLFGRYGGEEFLVVLPGATIEAAYVIAERVRNAFAALRFVAGGAQLVATVSAGVATATSVDGDLAAVTRVADAALYQAKSLGRNRVEQASPPAPSAPIAARIA